MDRVHEAYEAMIASLQSQYNEYGYSDFGQCHQNAVSDFDLTEEEAQELKDAYDRRQPNTGGHDPIR